MWQNSSLKIFVLLISLGVAFGHPRKQTKITLSSDELRRVVIDLIKSEIASQINSATAIPAPQNLTTQISETQSSIAELQREVVEVTQTFQQLVQETHQECQAVRVELSSGDDSRNTGANSTNIKDAVVRMSEDIRQIKQSIETLDFGRNSASSLLTTAVPHTGKSNLSSQEFDELIQTKTPSQIGNSFKGRSLPSIIDEVSRAASNPGFTRSVTVVFVNHLEETVTDFRMHDPKRIAYNLAPSSVSPHTEEVFTFKEPERGYVDTSFSYKISSINIRIAGVVKFTDDPNKVGLAFVSTGTDMVSYYNTMNGIPGSSQQNLMAGSSVQNVSVGYQSFYARMQVTPLDVSSNKASIRLEIIDARSSSTIPTTTPTTSYVW